MSPQPPTLSRETWSSHPHWPNQVLLLGSHENFRDISAFLVKQAELAGQGWGWGAIEHLLRRWVGAMRSHESYEEHKLYPYLEHRWGLDFAPCQLGHVALHGAYDAAISVLREGEDQPDAWSSLARALERHDEVLNAHLDIEEDVVIPALLGMEPAEFERYTALPLDRLLAGS